MINIGKTLKEHRERRGLTQTELAKRTGTKQQSIARWENNQNLPNIMDCIILACFYQISVDYLIGYENEDGTKNTVVNSFNNNSGTISFKG